MTIEDDNEMTMDYLLEEVRLFIRSKRNLAIDCAEFTQVKQTEGEFWRLLLQCIRNQANAVLGTEHCEEFSKRRTERRIATKTMSGINDPETKTKLLAVKKDDFNLNNIVDIWCRTEESTHKSKRKLISKNVNMLRDDQATSAQVGSMNCSRGWSKSKSKPLTQKYDGK